MAKTGSTHGPQYVACSSDLSTVGCNHQRLLTTSTCQAQKIRQDISSMRCDPWQLDAQAWRSRWRWCVFLFNLKSPLIVKPSLVWCFCCLAVGLYLAPPIPMCFNARSAFSPMPHLQFLIQTVYFLFWFKICFLNVTLSSLKWTMDCARRNPANFSTNFDFHKPTSLQIRTDTNC